jgi:hypothetical protein
MVQEAAVRSDHWKRVSGRGALPRRSRVAEPLHADSLEASLTVKSLEQSILDTEPTTVPWGARIIRFRDPDGFRFTLSSTVLASQ